MPSLLMSPSERTVRRWVASGRLPADASGPTLRLAVADRQPLFAAAVDTIPDQGQPPRAPAGHLPSCVRSRPVALDVEMDGAADRLYADGPCTDAHRTRMHTVATLHHRQLPNVATTHRRQMPSVATTRRRPTPSSSPRSRPASRICASASTTPSRPRQSCGRLLALALQKRALPEPKSEDLHNYTSSQHAPLVGALAGVA